MAANYWSLQDPYYNPYRSVGPLSLYSSQNEGDPRQSGYYDAQGNFYGNQPDQYTRRLVNTGDYATPNGDTQYSSFWGNYDPAGNLQSIYNQGEERSNGFIGDNINWLGPALVLAGAGIGSGMLSNLFSGTGAKVPGWVSGYDLPMGADLMSATGNVFSAPTMAQVQQALKAAGLTQTVIDQFLSDPKNLANLNIGGGGLANMLGAGVGVAGSLDAVNRLRDMGQGAQTDFNNLGATTQGQYNDLGNILRNQYVEWGQGANSAYGQAGQNLRGMFGDVGQQGYEDLYGFAQNIPPLYNALRDKYGPQYEDLAGSIKESVGEFTPYNVTTNVGTASKDKVTLTPELQAILGKSEGVAGNAFGAAQNFDIANARQEEFDLLMQQLAPKNEQARIANEARLLKQGRLDVANGQGYQPQTKALEEAIKQQELMALIQADDQAYKNYANLISAGNASMSPTYQLAQEGRGMLQLGSQMGATDFDAQTQGANTWAPYARGAIDYQAGIDKFATDQHLGTVRDALNFRNTANMQGVQGMAPFLMKGLDTQYNFFDKGLQDFGQYSGAGIAANARAVEQGIKAKLGSEKEATDAIINMYSALAGATRTAGASAIKDVGSGIKAIVDLFRGAGMTEEEALKYIQENVDSSWFAGLDAANGFGIGEDLSFLYDSGVPAI